MNLELREEALKALDALALELDVNPEEAACCVIEAWLNHRAKMLAASKARHPAFQQRGENWVVY